MNLEQAIKYLKDNGLAIGAASKGGDLSACNIINLYVMLSSSTGDPGAQGLLIAAVQDHQKSLVA
jgi:hypothetical protein